MNPAKISLFLNKKYKIYKIKDIMKKNVFM